MCGISGFFDPLDRRPDGEGMVRAMSASLAARGPDDHGAWCDRQAGIALGHQRLSIIDLSPAGHQPMHSGDGRYTLVYNGEIYNSGELKQDLEANVGIVLKGHSDTEVLLESCAAWGVEETVSRLLGMFAFAIWDGQQRRLTLVRDRLGIKPLYWGRFGSLFLFGSELKALRQHPGWRPEVDIDALADYCRYGYVPAPRSIYRGISKLEPGTILTVSSVGGVTQRSYWSLEEVAARGCAEPLLLSDSEAIEQLDHLLGDAVERRMIADVPLGAFLSGGVDSTTVTALMQSRVTRPVRSYSIGFREPDYDEAPYAGAVAAHLGTDHTQLYVSPEQALAVIPGLPDLYDEPFADASQIPTYLLSKLTHEHVTVALSGDGGDELFAGYNRHFYSLRISRLQQRVPRWLLGGTAGLIRRLPADALNRLGAHLPASMRVPQLGDKWHKAASVLAADPRSFHAILVSHWESERLLAPALGHCLPVSRTQGTPLQGLVEQMQLSDTRSYLPDDVLTKVDRASMAASLEARVPILDHRVVEFAWRLPLEMKLRHGQGKWLLKQLAYQYVPRQLLERPKAGFAIPVGDWLRGPLKHWGEALLDPARISTEGFFEPEMLRQTWDRHQSGRENHAYRLWIVLMFQAWRERWLPE